MSPLRGSDIAWMTGDGPDVRCCRFDLPIGFLSRPHGTRVDRVNGFDRMRLIFNGNAPFDAPRSRLVQPRIRSSSSLPFHRTPLIALHSIMTFGPSPVMYECLAGLREMVIDSERCPLTFAEFTLKKCMRDKNGAWIDEIPDGNDHSIDAVRYAMMEDVPRG